MARFEIKDGQPVIIDKWTAFDIIDRATHLGVPNIGINEAAQIMQQIVKSHDCEIGINWDVIDYHIETMEA